MAIKVAARSMDTLETKCPSEQLRNENERLRDKNKQLSEMLHSLTEWLFGRNLPLLDEEELAKVKAVEVGVAQYVCDPDTGERSFE